MKSRYRSRLSRNPDERILTEENGKSLKERFSQKERRTLTVERKWVTRAAGGWNMLWRIVGLLFSGIGIMALFVPALRICLLQLLQLFIIEMGGGFPS